MLRNILILLLLFLLTVSCSKKMGELNKTDIEQILNKSIEQYKLLSEACPDSLFPKTFDNGKLVTSDSKWWCSGFYPGTLSYLYEFSNDSDILNELTLKFKYLEKEKFNSQNHDIGFKINCSFGNMLRISKDSVKYSSIIIDAAKTLLTRYDPKLGLIRSWDNWNKKWQYAVIIDNMMNLELLLNAYKLSGDSQFYDAAISHADRTMKNHYRDDYSCFHVVSYDTLSGKPHLKMTHQGYSDSSAWARGQAWGLYGYTVMYKETGEQKYLEQANHIANFMLNNINTPKDLIFYWDFNAPNVPYAKRDASAAAITASALITLSELANNKEYLAKAKKILNRLSSADYFASLGENGNFLLKHSVGSMPHKSEVDVPLSYADYYFVEALMKLYKKL